jgi:peptidoglycan-associated lipoprotein
MSRTLHQVVFAALAVLFVAGCAKPKQAETEGAGAAGAQTTPVIGEQPIGYDPQGSDGGKIAGLYTINFEYDKATLTADARKKLADNAEWIKNNPKATVQIEGHTDERGSVEYNLSLGERRAKSVKTYLEGLGVDSKRLTVISYGEEKPVDAGHEDAAYSKNRRANFVPLQ